MGMPGRRLIVSHSWKSILLLNSSLSCLALWFTCEYSILFQILLPETLLAQGRVLELGQPLIIAHPKPQLRTMLGEQEPFLEIFDLETRSQ